MNYAEADKKMRDDLFCGGLGNSFDNYVVLLTTYLLLFSMILLLSAHYDLQCTLGRNILSNQLVMEKNSKF